MSSGESRAPRSRATARGDGCAYEGRETKMAMIRNNNRYSAKFNFPDVVVVGVEVRATVIPSRFSRERFEVTPNSYDFRETVRVGTKLIG